MTDSNTPRKYAYDEPWSRKRILETLSTLEDRALELGLVTLAGKLRKLSGKPPREHAIPDTPEEVLARCKLKPDVIAPRWTAVTAGRGSGRTVWMLANAVCALARGCFVELTAHSRDYERELIDRCSDMAIQCGLPRYEVEAWRVANLQRRYPDERLEFQDHFAREIEQVSSGVTREMERVFGGDRWGGHVATPDAAARRLQEWLPAGIQVRIVSDPTVPPGEVRLVCPRSDPAAPLEYVVMNGVVNREDPK